MIYGSVSAEYTMCFFQIVGKKSSLVTKFYTLMPFSIINKSALAFYLVGKLSPYLSNGNTFYKNIKLSMRLKLIKASNYLSIPALLLKVNIKKSNYSKRAS